MYIKRLVEPLLAKLIDKQIVVILLGARQVGKTTLVEEFIQNKKAAILNLDFAIDKDRLLAISALDIKEAMRLLKNPEILVIDEAQRMPEIGRIVKGWHDKRIKTHIVLLGSSSLDLLSKTAESLTGRNEKLFLTPLTFQEILQNQSWYSNSFTTAIIKNNFPNQIQSLLMQHIVYGGYPEAITTTEKEKYLINLTNDYLLKDILQSSLVKSPDIVKKLLALLAHQIGSEVSVNELSDTLQIARPTVERYLELLEQTFVIFKLSAFSTNQRKEIAKNSKIYFWDTGVRNAILREFSLSPIRSDIGALWENYCIAEAAKINLISGSLSNLYFWRTTDKSEVDLVIKRDGILQAYELKWKYRQSKKGLKSFTGRYGVPVEVITKDNFYNNFVPAVLKKKTSK